MGCALALWIPRSTSRVHITKSSDAGVQRKDDGHDTDRDDDDDDDDHHGNTSTEDGNTNTERESVIKKPLCQAADERSGARGGWGEGARCGSALVLVLVATAARPLWVSRVIGAPPLSMMFASSGNEFSLISRHCVARWAVRLGRHRPSSPCHTPYHIVR